MIVLRDRKACTGCTACAAACPLQCIRMEADREGFLYPVIDEAACVHCGLCEEACPVGRTGRDLQGKKQKEHEKRAGQDAYVLQHRDQEICRESTSGGAFTAVAEWIIERGGVVFGAAMQEDLTVRHIPGRIRRGFGSSGTANMCRVLSATPSVRQEPFWRRAGGSAIAGRPARSKASAPFWGRITKRFFVWTLSAGRFRLQ